MCAQFRGLEDFDGYWCGAHKNKAKTLAPQVQTLQFSVLKKPFGMHVREDAEGLPRVVEVVPGMPAQEAGVRVSSAEGLRPV